MSAQIRRKNDRSKLVEREYGRRLYATDLPYEEAMDQLTQKYLDSVKLIKQSEFKKPYLEDDYVAMEYAHNPPSWPINPYAPPNPGDTIIPDCKVGIEASGILEGWSDCDPDNDCSAWIFSCAHKLISITCGYCTIAKMTPLEGDRLEVIICSKEDKLDVKYQTTENPEKPSEWKEFQEHRSCICEDAATGCKNCDDCPTLSIGYTSQQMACGNAQNLTAIGGSGCFVWSIIAGTGAFIGGNTGKTVVFQAPATNEDCLNNPTVQVMDFCEKTASVSFAANCWADPDIAYNVVDCKYEKLYDCYIDGSNRPVASCETIKEHHKYQCDGTLDSSADCSSSGSYLTGAPGVPCSDLPESYMCASVPTCAAQAQGTCCGALGATCDARSAEMKIGGCCPVALL